ncbi:hypothetical protein FOD75_11535 (plasmid) [Limosilactobacillus reuteri]|uniref:Lipoprotein n=1 Tax=Limosilactobacillus reuteri TaxID=1598 RepID=A0A517D8M4_LIMRT|nr:hypothetical protein [Limosilactobacillus reuteri]QDR73713.1 hypothetical protein FOD75_11535 [Limosilactobacillus reuteri]
MKKAKLITIGLVGLVASLILTGCGNRATTANQMSSQSTQSSSSTPTLKVTLQRGKYQQAAGLLSVPVVLTNQGTNSTVINSENFTLNIAGHKFKPYQINGEPADYHYDFASGNIWQNTVSFDIGVHLTASELKQVKLTYKTDSGKSVTASKMSNTISQSKTKVSMQQTSGSPTDLGTYFNNAKEYQKTKKEREAENSRVPSLEDSFDDENYDQLRMWVAIPTTGSAGSKVAAVKIMNSTKTDMILPYRDFELVDKEGNEIQVDPSYRNYMLEIPHGKYTTVTIPMETTLKPSNGSYTVQLRKDPGGTSPSGSFFDTKDSFHEVEVVSSDETDIDTIFSLTADKYPSDDIKWSNQQVDTDNNKVSATVQLSDYFNLANRAAGYHVVGTNDDGTKKTVSVKKVTPKYVMTTDPAKVTWKVNNLADVMNYQHVVLQYKDKTILTLK